MKKKKILKIVDRTMGKVTEDILSRFHTSPLSFSQLKQQVSGFVPHFKQLTDKQLYNSAERIRKQGWLEKKVIEDEIFYSITAKGRVKQLVFKLRTGRKQKKEQSTILIFDIPEEKSKYRKFLRRLLIQMKFTAIQRSVLVAPYVLPQEFYDLLEELKLLRFIKVIEGRIRYN